ncbi:hypothetical protein Tco_0110156 [Tanacetum coccineum]
MIDTPYPMEVDTPHGYAVSSLMDTAYWFDKWCKEGPLCEIIPFRNRYESRLDEKASVADMIDNNNWLWPNGWTSKFRCLSNIVILDLKEGVNDCVLWKENSGTKGWPSRGLLCYLGQYGVLHRIVLRSAILVLLEVRKDIFKGHVARLEEPLIYCEWGYNLLNDALSCSDITIG